LGAGQLKIRVLQNFDCYEKGQVFENWPAGMCDLLVRRGLIEQVETAESVPETIERADMGIKTKPKQRR
jgi:hypothetical protein